MKVDSIHFKSKKYYNRLIIIIDNIINKTMTTTIEVPAGASVLNITQESDRILFEFVPKFKEDDFSKRKFKPGDKVKLKDGILDKNDESLYFAEDMNVFIGKVLTVGSYTSKGYLYLNEGNGWAFAEDWFELYSDEPIVGELAIFWDSFKELSHIRIYTQRLTERYGDHRGGFWTNAIKFESKEQFLEHIKG